MNSYENNFEGVKDRSVIISDLIEQIILVDEVIKKHEKAGTVGMQIEQYIERKQEFSERLNDYLKAVDMMIVDKQAA